LRVVPDTNIVLPGLLYSGAPAEVIHLARIKRIDIFTSVPMLDELAGILSRAKFATRVIASGLSISQLVAKFASVATVVTPQPIPRTAPDPNDDIILATAVAAQADYLITGDKPLLSLGAHAGFAIVSVNQFLANFRA
jgi:putative PIN family toxin of toxin-antitoxin system